jgi:hypothetical protein
LGGILIVPVSSLKVMGCFNPIHSISYNSHPMKSPFLDLLKRIADGVIIFEPFPRNAQTMLEFQDTVHRLLEMERLDLITLESLWP